MPGDWTSKEEITGARALKAIAYGDTMAAIANRTGDASLDTLLPMIDVARFRRRGNERTEMDWPTYRAMLERWVGHSAGYEKTLHRASEAGNVVYLDLDERATHEDGTVGALRSISIYEFDDDDRIIAVDVIMGFHQSQ